MGHYTKQIHLTSSLRFAEIDSRAEQQPACRFLRWLRCLMCRATSGWFQDARHQLCQVWCLPGTGLEGLELRLAQCLSLDKGGISRLVEAMFFSGTLLFVFSADFP